jgi:RNA-directed DNA polymerase
LHLEDDKRLNLQLRLDFSSAPTGEAWQAGREDIESSSAVSEPERPAKTRRNMVDVCERANLKEALRQVRGNKGSAGVDGMTVDPTWWLSQAALAGHSGAIADGTYEPKPVRRVEIPKPASGGVRSLASQPCWTALRPASGDAGAAQAMEPDVLPSQLWVSTASISTSSRGFALEKFFDRVNHDKLMGQIAKRVEDKRLLKPIRAFLNTGVMENGLVSLSVEEAPQGGPLSPLLSNLVLDVLDRGLERRGHRFVRYADD